MRSNIPHVQTLFWNRRISARAGVVTRFTFPEGFGPTQRMQALVVAWVNLGTSCGRNPDPASGQSARNHFSAWILFDDWLAICGRGSGYQGLPQSKETVHLEQTWSWKSRNSDTFPRTWEVGRNQGYSDIRSGLWFAHHTTQKHIFLNCTWDSWDDMFVDWESMVLGQSLWFA